MRLRVGVFVALLAAVAVSVGIFTSGASARFQANGVVPLFCTSDTIPTTTPLQLRIRWVVKNSGQITQFLAHQSLTWTVRAADGTVLATRTPNPTYGDTTYWSSPVHSTTLDIDNDGKIDDVWWADYLAPTGITLAAGESVSVSYLLTADAKTDDGFGFKFDKNETIAPAPGTPPCVVTGQ